MRFWPGLGAVAVCLLLGSFASAATVTITHYGTSIDMDFVTIGNAGNNADATGYGAVDYTYQIGTYEVTARQYTAFLNAVAASADTYGLYHLSMTGGQLGCKVGRSQSADGYSYSVADDYANRPVNCVSWYDAARFTNWLTTGDTESGVYVFVEGVFQGIDESKKTQGTAYWIPTEDEWYKAAYYKGGGTDAGYWLYPTQSDSVPGRDTDDECGNNANYYGSPYPIQPPCYTTEVGEFQDSCSAYGTYDQGGNVWEWNETAIRSARGFRGGSFYEDSVYLLSQIRYGDYPTREGSTLGFRVASSSVAAVPEPGSLIIWACGSLGVFVLRRRRR